MITYLIRRLIDGCHVWVRVTTSLATWRAIPRAVGPWITCGAAVFVPPSVTAPPPRDALPPAIERVVYPPRPVHPPGWKPGTVWTMPPKHVPVEYRERRDRHDRDDRHHDRHRPTHIPEPMTAGLLASWLVMAIGARAYHRRTMRAKGDQP